MMTVFLLVIFSIPVVEENNNFSIQSKPIGVYMNSKECNDLRDAMNPGLPKTQVAVCLPGQKYSHK